MAKILIVDDSAFMRQILKKIVAELGYKEILEAALGMQAIEEFKKKPDLVLLDMILPDMGGEEILVRMLKENPKANIIMVSAVGQKLMIDRCLKSGAKDYIVKPFDDKSIAKAIKNVLGK